MLKCGAPPTQIIAPVYVQILVKGFLVDLCADIRGDCVSLFGI